jgi:hypothetical protein
MCHPCDPRLVPAGVLAQRLGTRASLLWSLPSLNSCHPWAYLPPLGTSSCVQSPHWRIPSLVPHPCHAAAVWCPTPSTVQIQKLMTGFPANSHAYAYIAASLLVAFILGLLIYGIPIWTM